MLHRLPLSKLRFVKRGSARFLHPNAGKRIVKRVGGKSTKMRKNPLRNITLLSALVVLAVAPILGCSMMSAMHGAKTYQDPKTPCEMNYKSEGGRMSSGGIKTSTHVIFRNVSFKSLFNAAISAVSEYKYTVNSSSESSGMITANYDAGLGSGVQARIMVQLQRIGHNEINMNIRVTAPEVFADIPGDCCDVVKNVETQLNVKTVSDNRTIRLTQKTGRHNANNPPSISTTKELPAPVAKADEPSASAATSSSLVVSVNRALVRFLPNQRGRIVLHLRRGDTVSFLENRGAWYLIELPDGATGWSYETNFNGNR